MICVLITVVIAVSANKKKAEQEETVEASEEVDMASNLIAVPEVPLEQDVVPEINELFSKYYEAIVEGDTETIAKMVDHLDETEILKIQETSKYIESLSYIGILYENRAKRRKLYRICIRGMEILRLR